MAYVLWVVDLGLGLWLFLLSRALALGLFALFYREGAWSYARRVDFVDKILVLLFGLAWLTFMIVLEHYFRTSALTGDLPRRFAKVTGILLLSVFVVDMILFGVQGVGSSGWLRWLILAAELGIGILLILANKNRLAPKH
jgi:hypothetical protein